MKHSFQHPFWLLTLGLLVCFACEDKIEDPPDLGLDYFPVEVGTWVEYDVDSIVFDDFTGEVDTFQFRIREEVESVFEDLEGRSTQRLERWRKASDSSDWKLKDVWTANRTQTTAERVEENVRFVKLSFPVRDGLEWDGNVLNIFGEQEYEYLEADVPQTINGNSFEQTLSVLQRENINLIERQRAEERYARGVGMIYKETIDLDLQKDSGLIYIMEVRDFGVK